MVDKGLVKAIKGYGRGARDLAVDAYGGARDYALSHTPKEAQADAARLAQALLRAGAAGAVDFGDRALREGPVRAVNQAVIESLNPIPALRDAYRAGKTAMASNSRDAWKDAAATALLAAAALPPGPAGKGGKVAGAIGKGAKTTEDVAKAVAKARKPTRGILNTPDLRQMTSEEAVATARRQPHLMKSSDGTFVGGPTGVKGKTTLNRMRQTFDADVAAGASGGDWYTRARDENVVWAGPDPARQRLLAQEEALWSAQATPDTNMNFVLQGHNAYEAGAPLDTVRTPQQAKTYREARDAGAGLPVPEMMGHNGGPPMEGVYTDIPLGPKTGIYGQHLDPTVPHATTGTNDIWHARGFGYSNSDGSTFSRALTPQKHRFLDYETMLAVDRANAAQLGGRNDWQAHEIQAAPWVAGKGRALAESRGWTPEQGIAEAAKTYPDYADKFTAFATYEPQPYVQGGHLPNLAQNGSEAERAAYAADPAASWQDGQGRDIIYDALGMYQRPTQQATGVYTPQVEGAAMETNPAFVARPMVGVTGGAVDPASRELIDSAEALRSYADVQGAGAWHKLIANAPPTEMNSVYIPLDRKLTLEEILQIGERGGEAGLPGVLDSGQGYTVTSFDDNPPNSAGVAKAMRGGLGQDLQAITPGSDEARRVKRDGGYIGNEGLWEQGVGSGAATRALLDRLNNETIVAKLDADPAVRARIMAKMDRDAAYAAQTGDTVRPDVQNARRILGTEGISGLRRALMRGELLPATLVGILGAEMLSGQGSEPGA